MKGEAMSNRIDFLRTFDPGQQPAGTPATGVAPASPPVVTPPAGPTAEQMAMDNLRQAQAEQARVAAAAVAAHAALSAQQQAQHQAPPPAPASAQPNAMEQQMVEMIANQKRLERKLDEERRARERAELESYRQHAIGQVRANGGELLDGYVVGSTPEEIAASINVATREYELIAARVLAKHGQQAPQTQQGAPNTGAPVGVVQQPSMATAANGQPAQINAPTMTNGSAPPNNEPTGYTPEQIRYLTSSKAMETGEYAQHRHAIMQQLRGAAPSPAGAVGSQANWSLSQPYQFAPPMPQGTVGPSQGAMPPMPQPVARNMHAGISYPNVQPQRGILGPSGTYAAPPMSHQFAPQPSQLQQETGPGQYQAIPGATFNADAARAAAQQSVQPQRAAYGAGSIHGNLN
jgi:hypothetical protein